LLEGKHTEFNEISPLVLHLHSECLISLHETLSEEKNVDVVTEHTEPLLKSDDNLQYLDETYVPNRFKTSKKTLPSKVN